MIRILIFPIWMALLMAMRPVLSSLSDSLVDIKNTKRRLPQNCNTNPPLEPSYPSGDPKNGYQVWAASSSGAYQNSVYIPKKSDACDGMTLHWEITDSDKLKVAVAVQAEGWSAIGFSETGGMRGADLVYYEFKTNRLVDAYVRDGYVKPTDDANQNWTLLGSTKTDDGFLIFEAERSLDTGDTVHDRKIIDDSLLEVANHKIIGAWGNSETINYHFKNRITTSIQLFTSAEGSGNAYNTFIKQMENLSEGSIMLSLSNYKIPEDETTYKRRCFSNSALVTLGMLKHISSTTYILGFEFPIEETSVKYAHHIVVYGHMKEYNTNKVSCNDWYRSPIMVWAPGNNFYQFPEGGGLEVGNGPNLFNAFTIEYHFNNIDGDKNIIDNGSGVKLYFSSQPVQNEIGMIVVGDPNVELMGEPIGNDKTRHTFTCSASCSQQDIHDDEINIIFEGLHMHQVGRRIKNELIRGNSVVNGAIVDFYDFDQSGLSVPMQKQYKMKRGDYYRTTCYYESDQDTKFGLASNDEMCMTFLYYYPKQPAFFGCGIGQNFPCGADWARNTLGSDNNFDREFGKSATTKKSISWFRTSYSDISLSVGDSLTFNYNFHNVIEANKFQYDRCSGGTLVAGIFQNSYTATFDTRGTYYYYCGISGHCPPQRVKVVVSGGSPSTLSPSSAPSNLPAEDCGDVALEKVIYKGNKFNCSSFLNKNPSFVTKLCRKSSIYSKCKPFCEGKCKCKDNKDIKFDMYFNNGKSKKKKCSFLFGKKNKVRRLCQPEKSNANKLCPWACAYVC